MEELKKFVEGIWNESHRDALGMMLSGDRETLEYYKGFSDACKRIMNKIEEVQ